MQSFKTMPWFFLFFFSTVLAQIHQHMYKCVRCPHKYHREIRAKAFPTAPLRVIHHI